MKLKVPFSLIATVSVEINDTWIRFGFEWHIMRSIEYQATVID